MITIQTNKMEKDILIESILNDDISEEQRQKREDLHKQVELKRENELKAAAASARRGKLFRRYVAIALVALLVILAFFGRLVLKINELRKTRDEAQKSLEELQLRIEELESTLENVTSPEYIESQARSQLRMIYPDEVLYVVENDE